jgi:hypothetical protein
MYVISYSLIIASIQTVSRINRETDTSAFLSDCSLEMTFLRWLQGSVEKVFS